MCLILSNKFYTKPLVLFFIGMAGSGKTTLIKRMCTDLSCLKKNHYTINIDPASSGVPYTSNIDIRDTINYKKIMSEYNLGPNGAILAALNLFATRFTQIKDIIICSSDLIEYVLLDTPGQIEVFTWSASGSILCETFSSVFSVILIYVIDVIKTVYPFTFIGNILYCCSILYKSRLPVVVVINKNDIISIDFLKEWIKDFDTLHKALEKPNTFVGSFSKSLALTLENFYRKISFIGISALTGIGIYQLLTVLKRMHLEFLIYYQIELEKNIINHITNFQQIFTRNDILYDNIKFKKKSQTKQSILKKKEKINYLKTIEFIILLKIENDKIYSVCFFK